MAVYSPAFDLFLITGNTKCHPLHYLILSENASSTTGRSRLSKEKTYSWLTDGLIGYDTQTTSNMEQLNSLREQDKAHFRE
jgi:hypothetical protein